MANLFGGAGTDYCVLVDDGGLYFLAGYGTRLCMALQAFDGVPVTTGCPPLSVCIWPAVVMPIMLA